MKALTASILASLLGCGQAVKQNESMPHPPGTFLITAEQIERSGAHSAWQVLRQDAPISRRGRSSFILDEAPMIMLDGVRIPDFHSLETIDAQSIFTILIYDGVEGTTYYGTDAVSGVIVIKTKDGQS